MAIFVAPLSAGELQGGSSVVIASAISVTETQPMDFAIVIPDVAGDRIKLTIDDRTVGLGNSTVAGESKSAKFTVTGAPNSVVNISFSVFNVLTGPGADMRL